MASNQMDGISRELLAIWHAYRSYIIIIAAVVLAIARYTSQSQRGKPEVGSKLPSGVPETLKSDVDSKKAVREEGDHLTDRPALIKSKSGPKRVTGHKPAKVTNSKPETPVQHIQPLVFFYSLGGSSKAYADLLAAELHCDDNKVLTPVVHDLTQIDYDDYFVTTPRATPGTAYAYLLLIPSYDIDTELSNFLVHLEETHHDFRIDTAPLRNLAGYSVFGFGDRQEWPTEQEGYCSQAVEVDKWMARLTNRKRAFPLGLGDVRSDVQDRLLEWRRGVEAVIADISKGQGLGEGVPGSGAAVESDDEAEEDEEEGDVQDLDGSRTPKVRSKRSKTEDLEDIKAPIPVDFTTSKTTTKSTAAPKAMVPNTSPTYASLTKQGYTIVGSHSGVKICRWTKSALRGRGSCYKYSFYGIQSHLCMEATPSLSCSNKCVFCWRHGTNPVGTTWRWQVDAPQEIFDGMKEGHYKKIKMLKGVPGVRAERFSEAMRIRHCALSLVGEPIFYPHINDLLSMLHREHISSFLVCNAQHPDQLATLGPVTQLYVSIDASNKDSLRRIDRPLHRDFWERFIRCMDILREKRFTHRTVFRLTLVKGFNLEEEAEGYADLVARALPGFVEVKGVTYCGTSTAAGAGLSMQNVPFYEEVCAFVLALEAALKRRGLDYGIGAEHAHSCCILLADRQRFFRPSKADGVERWHTLIDYPAFFRCVESGKPFAPEDYIGEPTQEWALWGNGGFDPRDERVDRKGRPKEIQSNPVASAP